MCRTVCLLVGVLLVVPLLGSDAPKGYDGEAVWDGGLQGTWKFVMGGTAGDATVNVPAIPIVQAFRRGRWECRHNGRIVDEGVYATDTSRNPTCLDETSTVEGQATGKTRKLIYRIDGETLRTAVRLGEDGRPESFDEGGIYIITWKRVKK
jgi:uncharacterized protein (TIGR03067 family)